MSRRLLITDRYDDGLLQEIGHGRGPAGPWDILLLGLSNAWFLRSLGTAAPDKSWRLVDPAAHAEAAADRVGDYLVDLIARLPGTVLGGETLRDLFASPDGSEWWFLPITEKGPFRGPLVSQLYRLALARAVVDDGQYEDVVAAVADSSLAPNLCSLARDDDG